MSTLADVIGWVPVYRGDWRMEAQYLWPLVGVVLGSFLTFVITGLQSRADKRRKIATALSKLLAIYFQLRTVRSAIDDMLEHSESFQDFERYRYGVMQRHLLEPALLASLKDSVSDISGLFPIAALDLENLIQMLIRDKKGSLAGTSKVEEIYLKFFCIYEVSLDVTEKELVRYIRWLGWKHGIYTYLLVRKQLNKRISPQNAEFIANLKAEVMAKSNGLDAVTQTAS